jgi:uncharacterized membrane protein YhhN
VNPSLNPANTLGVMAGLILFLGGDIALILEDQRTLTVGLGLFLLAHIANIMTFSLLSPFSI